jgi:phosphoglycolate phosphatase
MYKTIMFDFDGTIVDSSQAIFKTMNDMAKPYKFREVTEEEFYALRPLSFKERSRILGIPLYKIPMMGADFKRLYMKHIKSVQLIEGMREVILTLKKIGHPIGIISSNAVPNIELFLKNNGLDLFDYVYSSGGLFGKHRTIGKFLKRMQLKTKDLIYVGDEVRDIEACRKVGVPVIAVAWGIDPPELLSESGPSYIAEQPKDIVEIVEDASVLGDRP